MEQDPLLALSPQSLAGLMQRQKMQQAAQQNRQAANPFSNLGVEQLYQTTDQNSAPVAGLWGGGGF